MSAPMPRLTEALVAHAADLRYEDLSPRTIAAARTFIMDGIAVGIAGSGPQVPLTTTVRDSAQALGAGSGNDARVWVTGERLHASSAAMVNGFQIHNQEFDCVHMPAVVHPMAVVLSSLVTAAEQRGGVDGKRLIAAVAIAVDVATLIGIPLYSNATAIIPVMESLIVKGLPLGTTLAFCMSTVAASIPEFVMLKQVMQWRLLAIVFLMLLIAFTVVGWALNAFS